MMRFILYVFLLALALQAQANMITVDVSGVLDTIEYAPLLPVFAAGDSYHAQFKYDTDAPATYDAGYFGGSVKDLTFSVGAYTGSAAHGSDPEGGFAADANNIGISSTNSVGTFAAGADNITAPDIIGSVGENDGHATYLAILDLLAAPFNATALPTDLDVTQLGRWCVSFGDVEALHGHVTDVSFSEAQAVPEPVSAALFLPVSAALFLMPFFSRRRSLTA